MLARYPLLAHLGLLLACLASLAAALFACAGLLARLEATQLSTQQAGVELTIADEYAVLDVDQIIYEIARRRTKRTAG